MGLLKFTILQARLPVCTAMRCGIAENLGKQVTVLIRAPLCAGRKATDGRAVERQVSVVWQLGAPGVAPVDGRHVVP